MSADPADPAGESSVALYALYCRERAAGNLALPLALNMYIYDTLDVGYSRGVQTYSILWRHRLDFSGYVR